MYALDVWYFTKNTWNLFTYLSKVDTWNKKEPHKIYKLFRSCNISFNYLYSILFFLRASKDIFISNKCTLKWLCINWCPFITMSTYVGLSWNSHYKKLWKRIMFYFHTALSHQTWNKKNATKPRISSNN